MPTSLPEHLQPTCPVCGRNKVKARGSKQCAQCRFHPGWHLPKAESAAIEPADESAPPPSTLFDDRWQTLNEWIGRHTTSTIRPPAPSSHDWLHICDTHIPYMDEDAFARAVEANRDCAAVVLGGDALNCAAFSRFIEGEHVNPKDEMAQLTLVLQKLAETFQNVYCGLGNHPDRIRKYFGARIPPYMMFLVQTNPIQFVVEGLRKERGYTNIHLAKPVIRDVDTGEWLILLDGVAYTHAETHSKLKMRPAENVARFLRKWQRHLPEWPTIICQEHNHTGGKIRDDELGAWLIQTPCLSHNVNYQVGSRIAYGPNQIGYTRIVRDAQGRPNGNASYYWLYDEDEQRGEAA